jgi:hypothetical protein
MSEMRLIEALLLVGSVAMISAPRLAGAFDEYQPHTCLRAVNQYRLTGRC